MMFDSARRLACRAGMGEDPPPPDPVPDPVPPPVPPGPPPIPPWWLYPPVSESHPVYIYRDAYGYDGTGGDGSTAQDWTKTIPWGWVLGSALAGYLAAKNR